MSKDEHYLCAWLHRKHKCPWMFTPNAAYGRLIYKSRHGTVYGIFESIQYGKPLWVGRLVENKWITWERELRAYKIEFGNGGEYVFPR